MNARVVVGGVRDLVAAIESAGFALVGVSPEGLADRYERSGASVNVLAPEGLGQRTDLTATPTGTMSTLTWPEVGVKGAILAHTVTPERLTPVLEVWDD